MRGIAETYNWKDSQGEKTIVYKAHCSCQDDRHTMTLTMEKTKDRIPSDIGGTNASTYDELTLTATFKFNIDDYYNTNWYSNKFKRLYKRFRNRIKMVFWILLCGTLPYELESDFLFSDVEQIDGFIKALQKGREEMLN
jgi:hypothetical protein